MSGTPRPDSILPPPTGSAGKVFGTRNTSTLRPASEAMAHIVFPFRLLMASGTS